MSGYSVRVGVGAFVLKSKPESHDNPKFLSGQRLNAHGEGTYALPGGHLEFGETLEKCAEREVMEETGLKVTKIRFLTATNDFMPDDKKHYVTMFVVCEREDESAEPQVLEPDKCRAWEWASWEDLLKWKDANEKGDDAGRKLFMPIINLIDQRPGVIPTKA